MRSMFCGEWNLIFGALSALIADIPERAIQPAMEHRFDGTERY